VTEVSELTAESAEEYTQSLSQVFAGSYRQILWAQQNGIPKALGLTTEEWVSKRLGGYVKMQIPDRRKAVVKLSNEGLSNPKIAEVLGVTKETVRRDKNPGTNVPPKQASSTTAAANEQASGTNVPTESDDTPAPPDIEAEAKTKTRKQRDLKAEAKREDKATREAKVTNVPPPDLREGKLKQALSDVKDVDLVFTDPPYPREYLSAWTELADWAAGALKPGALLVAYSGQYHLPEVIARLSSRLDYQWLGWLSTTGPQVAVHQRPIMSGGKPLLVFSNGELKEPFRSRRFFDSVDSEKRTRELHTWEQAEGPAAYYIEALTERGELVVDPFLGSGTFAYVASTLGRRVIGCDVDPVALATAKQRFAK
jgi:site-specific DNA-methyltransferase (adenine-specific)